MKVLQTAGQIAVHQVAAKGFNKVRRGVQLKVKQGRIGKKGGVGRSGSTKKQQSKQGEQPTEKQARGAEAEEVAPQRAEVGEKNVPAATRNNKESFNFTGTTLNHMNDPNRSLPVSILGSAIKNNKGLPDPQGTKALMYYTQIIRNRKTYNLEVLYDQATNTISHFKYSRDAMGPLKEIPKAK